jgi:hypothetical protein
MILRVGVEKDGGEGVSKAKLVIPKELQKEIKEARKQGIEIRRTRGNHLVIVPLDKDVPLQYVGGTPSDTRSIDNARSQLRRAGYKPK